MTENAARQGQAIADAVKTSSERIAHDLAQMVERSTQRSVEAQKIFMEHVEKQQNLVADAAKLQMELAERATDAATDFWRAGVQALITAQTSWFDMASRQYKAACSMASERR